MDDADTTSKLLIIDLVNSQLMLATEYVIVMVLHRVCGNEAKDKKAVIVIMSCLRLELFP